MRETTSADNVLAFVCLERAQADDDSLNLIICPSDFFRQRVAGARQFTLILSSRLRAPVFA